MAGYEITWSLPATKTIFGETSSTGGSTPVSGHRDPSASLLGCHLPAPEGPTVRINLIEKTSLTPDCVIGPEEVVRAGAGVRAQALDRAGGLVDDFRIHRLGPITTVRNAPSPAETSSMAIAEYVVDVIDGARGS